MFMEYQKKRIKRAPADGCTRGDLHSGRSHTERGALTHATSWMNPTEGTPVNEASQRDKNSKQSGSAVKEWGIISQQERFCWGRRRVTAGQLCT